MSCDKLVFDLSQEVEGSPNVFIKKDWLNILDNQNGNYNSNQSVLDTSQLSNSNKYMSYRESYLVIPMLLTLASQTLASAANFLPATAGTSADYAIGLKSWFGQIVHSLTLDYNGTTIIQQTPFINMWNSFKLITSLSSGDILTMGSTIGFYPDDPLSWSYQAAVSSTGLGTCNNTNFGVTVFGGTVQGVFSKFNSEGGNRGFMKRQQFINYDVDGDSGSATFAGQLDVAQTATLWKSYISTKINGINATNQGVFQISITAIVYLKHLHSFFQMTPLLKGVFMKATLTLNNTTIDFTTAAGGAALTSYTLNSVSNSVGGVCPIMLASGIASNGAVAAFGIGAMNYRANLSVGAVCLDSALKSTAGVADGTLSRNIYLYVPSYTFNPVFEQAYLSSPIKTINYTDVYQYQITNITAKTGQINNLLTNGIANIKSVLLLPFYSAATNLIIGAAATSLPVYQSPYDPAGTGMTSPMCLLSNFNVVVSGQNIIYNTERYAFEQFANQLYGTNAVNGGMTDGLTSGLIDQLSFEQGYCYYYVDVSRMLPVEESVPKSVQIIGQNMSARAIDIWSFISYGVSISIDVLTGARI
jgi:hypothetical protein